MELPGTYEGLSKRPKRAGSVVERLPSKYEALSSNSGTDKERERKKDR
jgi:hypothetical protein